MKLKCLRQKNIQNPCLQQRIILHSLTIRLIIWVIRRRRDIVQKHYRSKDRRSISLPSFLNRTEIRLLNGIRSI